MPSQALPNMKMKGKQPVKETITTNRKYLKYIKGAYKLKPRRKEGKEYYMKFKRDRS